MNNQLCEFIVYISNSLDFSCKRCKHSLFHDYYNKCIYCGFRTYNINIDKPRKSINKKSNFEYAKCYYTIAWEFFKTVHISKNIYEIGILI